MNSYIDIDMRITFPNSIVELTQAQKDRFRLFDGYTEITLFRYETEFKALLNDEIKVDYNNPEQVEEHFKLLSYFDDTEINKFYREIYAIESKPFKKEVENFMEIVFGKLGTDQFIEPHYRSRILWNENTSLETITNFTENNLLSVHNWWGISANVNLTREFIEKYEDKLIWRFLCYHCRYPDLLVKHELCYKNISQNLRLSDSFIQTYVDKLDWNNPYLYFRSTKFLSQNLSKLNHKLVCRYADFDFIQNNIKPIRWKQISYNSKIPEYFYTENLDLLDWSEISGNTGISESFYRKHIDKIDWNEMSANVNIPKSFLIEFKHKLNLEMLAGNRSIDPEFWSDKPFHLYKTRLSINSNISPEFYLENFDNLDLDSLIKNHFRYYINRKVRSIKKYSFDNLWQKIENNGYFY